MDVPETCSEPGCDRVVRNKARKLCNRHYLRFMRHGSTEAMKPGNGEAIAWLHEHATYRGDKCLIWPFAKGYDGRGSVRLGGRSMFAARAMCIIAHGSPPFSKADAAHKCGRGHEGCVSPNCVRWATRSANVEDAREHGTLLMGEAHGSSKLTESQARYILDSGDTQAAIAAQFCVSQATVGKIRTGETWKHLQRTRAA